jgi:hypothetical protein
MADNTIPPSTAPRVNTVNLTGGEQAAKIVRLPDALQDVARARRLEGEVVKQNTDGSVRIKTSEGDIDVNVRGRQPQPGQKVEIDIPPGRPPRQAIVRPAAPAPVPVDIQITPRPSVPVSTPQVQTPAAQPLPPRVAPNTPPVIQTPIATTPNAPVEKPIPVLPPALPSAQRGDGNAAPQTPLQPGTVVRLLPVAPAPVQQILNGFASSVAIIPATLARVQIAASVIAQNVQADLTNDVLSVVRPAAGQFPASVPVTAATSTPATLSHFFPALSSPVTGAPTSLFQFISQVLNIPPAATPISTATVFPAGGVFTAPAAPLLSPITFNPSVPPTNAFTGVGKTIALDAQVFHIKPPDVAFSPPSAAIPPGQAGQITANVLALTPQSLPLVSIQLPGANIPQTFVLQFTGSNLSPGTQVSLLPVPGNAVPTTPALLPGTLPALTQSLAWPVLDDLLQTLSQISPSATASLTRTLPSPANPAQMGPAALLFIAAVKSGDIESWLGDRKIGALTRAGKAGALSALNTDAATASRLSAEPVSGDWRAMPLPLHWQGEVHKVMLYTKQDGQNTPDERNGNGHTRFIFDLDLTRMGDVQIDGLMRGPRLDLVVRTQTYMSAGMQTAIRGAFTRALDDTSLHGDITFQGDPRQWVNVVKKEERVGVEI